MAERKPSSANIDTSGRITQLDGKAAPDEVVTEDDVKEASKLARILFRILKELAEIRRRWWPRKLDFTDMTLDAAGTLFYLPHDFNGRVRFWVVDFRVVGAAGAPIIQRDATETTPNVLALRSYKEAEVTIRVEEAG